MFHRWQATWHSTRHSSSTPQPQNPHLAGIVKEQVGACTAVCVAGRRQLSTGVELLHDCTPCLLHAGAARSRVIISLVINPCPSCPGALTRLRAHELEGVHRVALLPAGDGGREALQVVRLQDRGVLCIGIALEVVLAGEGCGAQSRRAGGQLQEHVIAWKQAYGVAEAHGR